jgi:hypothetical protein
VAERDRAGAATTRGQRGYLARSPVVSWALRIGTAAALGIDAGVHAYNASGYDELSGTITQGNLFRVEAGVACAVALGVLIWPRRSTWIAALLVAASALGAVLLYRYVDVGALGPLPNMYENTWDVPGKVLSAWAEGAAVILAALGLLDHIMRTRADRGGDRVGRRR